MKNVKINPEIDISDLLRNIFYNKARLFMVVIIAIFVAIVHDNYKKPFVPLYEISLELKEISLFEELQYNDLNNFIRLLDLDYQGIREAHNSNFVINSKKLFRIYLSLFQEQALEYFDKKNIDISDTGSKKVSKKEQDNLSEYDYGNKIIIVKFVSENDNLKMWNTSFQNIHEITNDLTRNILLNNYNSLIKSIKDLSLRNNTSTQDNLEGIVSKKINYDELINQYDIILNASPLNNLDKFRSAVIKKTNIEIINIDEKGLELKGKILLSIMIFFVLFIIYISIEDSIKKGIKKSKREKKLVN